MTVTQAFTYLLGSFAAGLGAGFVMYAFRRFLEGL